MRIALTLDAGVPIETNDYLRALLDAGARRDEIVVLRPGDPIQEGFDGVVIGGGDDVNPGLYGRPILDEGNVEVDAARDAIDFPVFDEAWREEVPILGICRGLQVVNVARGGTLIQDLPLENPSDVAHRHPKEPNRRDHPVDIRAGSRLARIAGVPQIDVNSRHHQAVDQPAKDFVVTATAPDGVIEALEARDGRWLVAVQWHPENLTDDDASRRLFREFVDAARQRGSRFEVRGSS
ncbi:MAG TPA: gamma-glutamyl-gamma-aminobutyrate hydrolase family protein [Thermoanaerobaculia bacterium]|nr:gamma-glutamyl-gamma-aminobutyrate hydrolase family protein [Thermoanaerobaculia bacterium]